MNFLRKEVDLVKKFVQRLKSCRINPNQIGIISSYSAQRTLLRKNIDQIEIENIDSFQGREKDFILFSCVRCGHNIGFLGDQRRLNTAITKAK